MRIIKEGDPAKKPKPITFTCENCGCVFEEEDVDYELFPQSSTHYLSVCPNCKYGVSVRK